MLKTYYLICDYREKFGSDIPNDHYSKRSLFQIQKSIIAAGYNCVYFGGINELIHAVETGKYDKNGVYLNFNDGIETKSKRGQSPMLLELMGVKYSGSSPLTHLAASDKYFTNKFLDNKVPNLFIPKYQLLKNACNLQNTTLNFPIILKPNDEGSSLGINDFSVCYNVDDALIQYQSIQSFGDILAQEFIGGYELTNYIIRDHSGEILFNELILIGKNDSAEMNNMIFTYYDKSEHRRTYYDPLDYIDSKAIEHIKLTTAKIASTINILSLGRVDYRYFQDKLYFIEVNTVPAFSITSDVGEICNLRNYDFNEVVRLFLESVD